MPDGVGYGDLSRALIARLHLASRPDLDETAVAAFLDVSAGIRAGPPRKARTGAELG